MSAREISRAEQIATLEQAIAGHRSAITRLQSNLGRLRSLPGRERSGQASVAAQIQRFEDRDVDNEPMDLATGLEWGRRNGVKLSGDPVQSWAAVNDLRSSYGLPRFRLVAPRTPITPLPEPHIGGDGS